MLHDPVLKYYVAVAIVGPLSGLKTMRANVRPSLKTACQQLNTTCLMANHCASSCGQKACSMPSQNCTASCDRSDGVAAAEFITLLVVMGRGACRGAAGGGGTGDECSGGAMGRGGAVCEGDMQAAVGSPRLTRAASSDAGAL